MNDGKERKISRFPKALIEEPLAARNVAEGRLRRCEGDAGKTETSAPLSTRKARRWRRQKTEREPWPGDAEGREEIADAVPGVFIDPRLLRFPRPRPRTLTAEGEA